MTPDEYRAIVLEHGAAVELADEAIAAANTARDEANALAEQEFAARKTLLAAERDALTARAVLAARGEDTTEADAVLADYAEALGQHSAQYTRPTFEEAMAAARGE